MDSKTRNGKWQFTYTDDKYYLIKPSWPTTGTKSIYKEAGTHEKIGNHVDVRKKCKKSGFIFKEPFLYGDYLYYYFKIIHFKRFGMSDWIWLDNRYIRYEFYKFGLQTGENEDITLKEFVEALHAVYNTCEINPNYKGKNKMQKINVLFKNTFLGCIQSLFFVAYNNSRVKTYANSNPDWDNSSSSITYHGFDLSNLLPFRDYAVS